MAFSTIGYGDLSPATPAGRSVFVVWALVGVGAMTILISGMFTVLQAKKGLKSLAIVLSEAYASRYKSVLSQGSFEQAVKNFRGRRASSRDASPDRHCTREHARRNLEGLPAELLTHAKTFHEHIYYFSNSLNGYEQPPQTLRKLLDEIAESEHMDARLKLEMMRDEHARKVFSCVAYMHSLRFLLTTCIQTLFIMSYEGKWRLSFIYALLIVLNQ